MATPAQPVMDVAAATAAMARDPVLGPFVERVGPVATRRRQGTSFEALARAIVFQQLAGAAASTIHARAVAALGGRMTAEAILATPDEPLRVAGLSAAKLAALRDLAQKTTDGTVPLRSLGRFDDETIIERLVAVRGIGRWTAEMFLLFQLRRPDVWPVGDLGVRAGYARLHGLAATPTEREIAPLGDRFRPWRSAAAWYCWQAVALLPPTRGGAGATEA